MTPEQLMTRIQNLEADQVAHGLALGLLLMAAPRGVPSALVQLANSPDWALPLQLTDAQISRISGLLQQLGDVPN